MGGRAKAAVGKARAMTAVSFAEAMEMVKDKEKAEAFFARLEACKAGISAEFDKSLTIDEIDRLLIQTRNNHNMSAEELAGAQKDADELRAECRDLARKGAEESDRRFSAREQALEVAETRLKAGQRAFKKATESQQEAMDARESAVILSGERASALAAQAAATKDRYEGLLAEHKRISAAA